MRDAIYYPLLLAHRLLDVVHSRLSARIYAEDVRRMKAAALPVGTWVLLAGDSRTWMVARYDVDANDYKLQLVGNVEVFTFARRETLKVLELE